MLSVTTGEWSDIMREVYGEYRAPTGILSLHVSKSNTKESEIKFYKMKLKN